MNVFDIDGTIADTSDIVCRAYRKVGVKVLPPELKTHWREWLLPKVGWNENAAAAVRALKTSEYLRMLREETPPLLPAGHAAHMLLARGDPVRAITAAHPAGARAVLKSVGLEEVPLLGCEVAGHDRPEILRALAAEGTYWDDNEETAHAVSAETAWEVVCC